MKKLLCSAVILTAFITGQTFGQGVQVDSNLNDYTPVAGVAGTIKSVGSDTMNNMMTLWSEGFLKYYPNVRVEIEGKGSSTAPPALISGTSTFGPMSRKMRIRPCGFSWRKAAVVVSSMGWCLMKNGTRITPSSFLGKPFSWMSSARIIFRERWWTITTTSTGPVSKSRIRTPSSPAVVGIPSRLNQSFFPGAWPSSSTQYMGT